MTIRCISPIFEFPFKKAVTWVILTSSLIIGVNIQLVYLFNRNLSMTASAEIGCVPYLEVWHTSNLCSTPQSLVDAHCWSAVQWRCQDAKPVEISLGAPKQPNRSQLLVGRSSPYCEDMWRRYCCLTSFFSDRRYEPQLPRYSPIKLCDGAQTANFWRVFASCIFSEPHAARFRPAS